MSDTPHMSVELTAERFTHLRRLEAEAIHIMREVAAEAENPVMLYSVGKDSSVLLHLAMKAFYPSKPPFPFMHVDTTWKFSEMIQFRDDMCKKLGKERTFRLLRRNLALSSGSQCCIQYRRADDACSK